MPAARQERRWQDAGHDAVEMMNSSPCTVLHIPNIHYTYTVPYTLLLLLLLLFLFKYIKEEIYS